MRIVHAQPEGVAERPTAYRSRRPEGTPFYRLVMDHFDRFARTHEERFEHTDSPLRPVVHQVVGQYLDCGLLENGFARVRCPKCLAEYFCALTCRSNCTSSVHGGSCPASRVHRVYMQVPSDIVDSARADSEPILGPADLQRGRQTPSFFAVSVSVGRPAPRSRA